MAVGLPLRQIDRKKGLGEITENTLHSFKQNDTFCSSLE